MVIRRFVAVVALLGGVVVAAAPPVSADPVSAGHAEAFAIRASFLGAEVIPPTTEAAVDLPAADVDETLIPIPAAPLLVSGTLNASAAVHASSDVASSLSPQTTQAVAGPYNARGVGLVEGLDVLIDAVEADVPLVRADEVRAEAVAVCTAGAVQYSATSEIIDLVVGGTVVLPNTAVQDLLDAVQGVLVSVGLAPDVINVERNVVTELEGGGISVDALHITALAALGDPLADVTIGHAEVSGVTCGAAALPECSDNVDNTDPEDTLIDEADPGCHTDGDPNNPATYDPNDNDEKDVPECSDNRDNTDPEDILIDELDPGCHTDGNPLNPSSYDPNDDDERNETARTGGPLDGFALVGGGLLLAALGLSELRRRQAAL